MADNDTAPEPADITAISRRTAVAGMLSIAGLAAAACTRYGNPTTQSTETEDNGGGAVIGRTSDVPVGGGIIVGDQNVVVTQPTAGTFKAFSAVCTHQACILADVANGTINCNCHGSKFAIADGSVANGPASTPLPQRSITVAGDQISLS